MSTGSFRVEADRVKTDLTFHHRTATEMQTAVTAHTAPASAPAGVVNANAYGASRPMITNASIDGEIEREPVSDCRLKSSSRPAASDQIVVQTYVAKMGGSKEPEAPCCWDAGCCPL